MEKLTKNTNIDHILKTNELIDKVNELEESGGKIQIVKVNDAPLEIKPEDKSVNIDLSSYAEDEDVFLWVGDSENIPQDKLRENMIIIDPDERIIGSNVDIDDSLSVDSENPVQNKVITEKFNGLDKDIDELKTNGGKIQSVKVNNTLLEIAEDKSVNIDLTGYAEDDDIFLYVGDSEQIPADKLKENMIIIDPDEINSGSNIEIDGSLSDVSENPVQNKIITSEINKIKDGIFLYVGKIPEDISEFNENTIFIDPDENAAVATLLGFTEANRTEESVSFHSIDDIIDLNKEKNNIIAIDTTDRTEPVEIIGISDPESDIKDFTVIISGTDNPEIIWKNFSYCCEPLKKNAGKTLIVKCLYVKHLNKSFILSMHNEL